MIRSVRGRVVAHEAEGPVVEVGGVGLLGRVSATTAATLPAVGAETSLLTVLAVREESLDLYGFASAGERALFEAFTGVSGVGLTPASLPPPESSGSRWRAATAPACRPRAGWGSARPSGWCSSCATGWARSTAARRPP